MRMYGEQLVLLFMFRVVNSIDEIALPLTYSTPAHLKLPLTYSCSLITASKHSLHHGLVIGMPPPPNYDLTQAVDRTLSHT